MIRFLLIVVLLTGLGAWWLGYLPPRWSTATAPAASAPVHTGDTREQISDGIDRIAEGIDDTALTAKIKSKMALDDTVKAGEIDVDTANGVVTVTGVVRGERERQRALDLARETLGVKSVNDRLAVRP